VAIDDAGGIISTGLIGQYYFGTGARSATFGGVVLSVAGKASEGVVWKLNKQGTTDNSRYGPGNQSDTPVGECEQPPTLKLYLAP
jgi:hypothetical protein